MALLFAAGASLASLLYVFTPSLSTVVISSTGSLVFNWALQKYLVSSLGNYYYVYQLATSTTPNNIAEEAVTGPPGALGLTWAATKMTARTGANIAYYGSKGAYKATSLAASTAVQAGSLLLMTVTKSGHVAYTLIQQSASPSKELFKYIKAQEPTCTLEDFYEWETVEVNILPGDERSEDEEMKKLRNSWQLIQHKDEVFESTLLSDSNSSMDDSILDSEWTVVEDDYLFREGEIPDDLGGFEPDTFSDDLVDDYLL